jgi:hypothetical protein
MCGETWWGDCRFVAAKNMPLFSTLFLGIPEMGSGEVEKQISPLRFASVEMTIRGVQEEGITSGG